MSANIYWEPVRKGESLYTMAPESFMNALNSAGFSIPGELTANDLPALRGMAAAHGVGDDRKNPYSQLANAIEECGTIRIWAVY